MRRVRFISSGTNLRQTLPYVHLTNPDASIACALPSCNWHTLYISGTLVWKFDVALGACESVGGEEFRSKLPVEAREDCRNRDTQVRICRDTNWSA